MEDLSFFDNYKEIFAAIDFCVANCLKVPALILIFAAIDSVSWIANDEHPRSSVSCYFPLWVETWMLKSHPLPCTAIELYAARCAVVHTLTPTSRLSATKGVKELAYAWSATEQRALELTIHNSGDSGPYVAISVLDILASFREGWENFWASIDADPIRRNRIYQRAKKQYKHLDDLS
jgi:hypothetical protein